jgi:ribonuclease I
MDSPKGAATAGRQVAQLDVVEAVEWVSPRAALKDLSSEHPSDELVEYAWAASAAGKRESSSEYFLDDERALRWEYAKAAVKGGHWE